MLFFQQKSVSLAWCLLSLFLCPSYSIFQICGYAINLSLILQTTWIQKQFPLSFSSLLTLLLSVLYKTWVAMRFPAKITSSCIWVAISVNWVILHWYDCGADGQPVGRSVYGHVITKFSRMGRLPHFLSRGAPLLSTIYKRNIKLTGALRHV